jgi:thiamine kinase-like enzyme
MAGLQLVVLAAGMGRRFGGDKQMAEVGPHGEWLLDYALYDARLAGFTEAILVVRHEMIVWSEREFPLPVQLAYQMPLLGTAHALWAARDLIKGPFAVINADDFYGRASYFQLAGFLREVCSPSEYAVIGFPLGETLADSGPVSRAVLQTDPEGFLVDIEEYKGLEKNNSEASLHALVSMNSWALDRSFMDFLEEKIPPLLGEVNEKELLLPTMIRQAMAERSVRVKVLPARTRWIGITHLSDLELVRDRMRRLYEEEVFPAFFPSGKITKTRVLTGGYINQTSLVEWSSDRETFQTVFQGINPTIFPDPELLNKNNELIAAHLKAHSYPKEILVPLATPEGKTLVPALDGAWRAFPFIAGTFTRTKATDASEVRAAAAAIGEWHSFLKDMDPLSIQPAIPHFFDLTYRWKQFMVVRQNAPEDRSRKAWLEILQLSSEGRDLTWHYEYLKTFNPLPLRILHGDPKLSNILFDEKTGEVRAIIDWDTVQPGWIIFDFGDMVRAYTNPCAEDEPDVMKVKVHRPYMDALLEGFLAQTEPWLRPSERINLRLGAQCVIWLQALRFLADYLSGDHYYPVEYPEQNLVRARNQLRLLNSIKFSF